MKVIVRRNRNLQYYFPRGVADIAGVEAELIPNAHALVMFPKGSSPRRVLRSLAVIQLDLENQIVVEEEEQMEELEEPRTPSKLVFEALRRGLKGG